MKPVYLIYVINLLQGVIAAWCDPILSLNVCLVAFTGLNWFLIGFFPSPCLIYLFRWGVFHHLGWYSYSCPPWGVWINGGSWWPLVNYLSFLWSACLVLPCFSLLLREMLFNGISQWHRETLVFWPSFLDRGVLITLFSVLLIG